MHKLRIAKAIYFLLLNLLCFILWQIAAYKFEFKNPEYLWLLLSIPLLSIWLVFRKQDVGQSIALSSFSQLYTRGIDWLAFFRPSVLLFRFVAICALCLAVARPQSKDSFQNANVEGVDIMVALDISASMLAKDFEPNRLEASKNVAIDFINKRENDRIGLVVYEGESFTQCPLTTDHNVLINLFKDVKTGYVEGGTAIGMGLATAVNRLRDSEAKSKVIILLTDGVNNQGSIAPITAAQIAKEFGIKVYTIGVGSKGMALSPVRKYGDQYQYDYTKVEIDELTLEKIAYETDGKYFRATDNTSLTEIYTEIDKLEKTEIKVTEYTKRNEEYFPFLLLGIIALVTEWLLVSTLFKSIP
tara:strand:+ start:58976 stop:60049 length:1074 start_codon:yes stop_codon:yes gene_type:complete